MTSTNWLQVEYEALRAEILALGEAERNAVKFYVPAAAVVYAVPYALLHQTSRIASAEQHQAFIWTFCAAVAGLLTLGMLQSIFWSVDGARRLGMYIMNAIEPRTNGGLRWEWTLYQLHTRRSKWASDSLTVAVAAVLANLAVAYAAASVFLNGSEQFGPPCVAAAFAGMSLPILKRIDTKSQTRRAYAERVIALMDQFPEAATEHTFSVASRTG